jgi:hypothetical protein
LKKIAANGTLSIAARTVRKTRRVMQHVVYDIEYELRRDWLTVGPELLRLRLLQRLAKATIENGVAGRRSDDGLSITGQARASRRDRGKLGCKRGCGKSMRPPEGEQPIPAKLAHTHLIE